MKFRIKYNLFDPVNESLIQCSDVIEAENPDELAKELRESRKLKLHWSDFSITQIEEVKEK